MNLNNKKILVTGGGGFLGQYVVSELKAKGAEDIFVPRSTEYDLRSTLVCKKVVKNVDVVIHLAAQIGGIGFIGEHSGEIFYNNLVMGVELMEAARKEGIEKFVSIGTVCEYPKSPPLPFKEENLWDGYPEETTAPYGWAKKMLIVQGNAYKTQYGFNAIHLLPVNLYGPGDNFVPRTAHVIPALIRRIIEARNLGKPKVEVWGTGKATREFLYVKDAAEGIVLATQEYDKPEPVNLGSGQEIAIKKVVELIVELTGYKGDIEWNKSKPDGQPRRQLDVSMAKSQFGFSAKMVFRDGLKKTIDWYERQL
ncbi:GDP-fucose synthetase [Candidatus Roizmanbacteria bacterium CG22_combo_CG10-13_8_21_14_all_38_20]|uniref:GDP-L-fucose synthase n=1 Tax=Candidatus Roizmanbacteria bacterium CG22_combo_CG10-13_8_21_14_all_38_20 TaxID=1974862 RepID=A0A2H0BYA2_9BACT|nr:GDP-L-fucose synthase [Candidatus Microgenomates bacterium]PIP61938.1 MAG: GDP-fucose synthetase [Candidatus Roizmanbacteria bacterium CG22_combo_CG10-13_8_21_14_all_38_20]PJC32087.1 MAG: GDP-fucose synthetase [Candidatus Roizmanbacteria bacterium CG_4_9_14_0_2_um_filter_38_17]